MDKNKLWVNLLNTILRDMGINKKGREKIFEFVAKLTEDKKYLICRR